MPMRAKFWWTDKPHGVTLTPSKDKTWVTRMERCRVEILYVTEGERDVNEQSIEAQRVHLRNCNTVDQ